MATRWVGVRRREYLADGGVLEDLWRQRRRPVEVPAPVTVPDTAAGTTSTSGELRHTGTWDEFGRVFLESL